MTSAKHSHYLRVIYSHYLRAIYSHYLRVIFFNLIWSFWLMSFFVYSFKATRKHKEIIIFEVCRIRVLTPSLGALMRTCFDMLVPGTAFCKEMWAFAFSICEMQFRPCARDNVVLLNRYAGFLP